MDVAKQLLDEIRTVFKLKYLPREEDRFEPVKGTIRDYINKIFNMRDF
jgi:hypothetical protein